VAPVGWVAVLEPVGVEQGEVEKVDGVIKVVIAGEGTELVLGEVGGGEVGGYACAGREADEGVFGVEIEPGETDDTGVEEEFDLEVAGFFGGGEVADVLVSYDEAVGELLDGDVVVGDQVGKEGGDAGEVEVVFE